MIILGISDSHESHACVVRDGKLLSAIAEERLSRLKTDIGYPKQAIDKALEIAGVAPDEIDVVAFAGRVGAPFSLIYKMHPLFSVRDWIRQNYLYWKPILIDGEALTQRDDFEHWRHLRPDIESDPYYSFVERSHGVATTEYRQLFNDVRRETVVEHLRVSPEIIRMFRHEDCHKAYGFYSQAERRDTVLLMTIEGGGDDSSATVSTVSNGAIKEHFRTNDAMTGRLYRYVTLFLGMKPCQHEYKVMGLAPYGTEYHGQRALEFFRHFDRVDGEKIVNPREYKDCYFSTREHLEGERFDGVAWGLQTHLEELLCNWVQNCVDRFGIRDVVLSGGVAQNIKAVKAVADQVDLGSIWAGPISGDGSLGIGAAWLACREFDPGADIEGLTHIYLGTQPTKAAIHDAIRRRAVGNQYTVIENPSADDAAGWLDAGLVIARFAGRMEFGQRALGNRSILADPRRFESVERINRKIKNRDFWMPFTPSMTWEEGNEVLVNPRGIYSPYMTMAFDLKPGHADQLPAVVHPADKTARAQMLKRSDNPGYYDILTAMKQRTGRAIVLNTSFNLHGDAIVETPDQAFDTLDNSDLDVLMFEDVAVARRLSTT